MASKKKTTTITEILPENESNENQSGKMIDGITDYGVVLTKVHRLVNGKRSFCFQTEETVDEVMIQNQYPNGGSFGVEEFNDIGQSISRVVMDIEPKPMTNAIINPSMSTPTSGNDFQIRLLMDELAWTRNMITNMITNRNGDKESTPIGELVMAMQGMHGMMGGKDPLDLLTRGMELAAKFGNGGGSADWKTELLSTVKENLGPIISMVSANRTPQQTQHPNGNENGENMRPANILPQETIMKQALTWLKKQIIGGLTVDLAVDWIVNNANDPQYTPILQQAVNGTIDNFIAIDSELGNEPYRTWLTTAIQDIKDWYAEQNTNAGDNDGGNGNGSNVTVNAKPSTRKSAIKKTV